MINTLVTDLAGAIQVYENSWYIVRGTQLYIMARSEAGRCGGCDGDIAVCNDWNRVEQQITQENSDGTDGT